MRDQVYEIEVYNSRWRGSWEEICELKYALGGAYPVYIIKQSKFNTNAPTDKDQSDTLQDLDWRAIGCL